MPNIREEFEAAIKVEHSLLHYEVRFRTYGEKGTWTGAFLAESFAHAEEQAQQCLGKDEFISNISLDF